MVVKTGGGEPKSNRLSPLLFLFLHLHFQTLPGLITWRLEVEEERKQRETYEDDIRVLAQAWLSDSILLSRLVWIGHGSS